MIIALSFLKSTLPANHRLEPPAADGIMSRRRCLPYAHFDQLMDVVKNEAQL